MGFFVGEHPSFEVSALGAFGAHACSGEVGRAEKGSLSIDDDGLGVHAWTEDALEKITFDQARVCLLYTSPSPRDS